MASAIATEQPFPTAELADRLARVRGAMTGAGVDLLIASDPNDIYYLTGARELGGLIQMALLVPASGAMAFVGRAVDAVAFVAHTGNNAIHPYRDHENAEAAVGRAITALGAAGGRIGYSGSALSVATLSALRQALPQATWVDATRFIWDISALKSPRELDYMREAARINAKALDRAIASIGPGVSDNHIAAELYAGMLENGSHPMTHFMLATGPRTAVVHATFNDRKLEKDDIVHFEFSATRYLYAAPLMRTATLGTPNAEAVKLHDGALAAVEAAMATIREGVTSGEVDRAANAELEKRGIRQWHYHRTGYMVGMAAGGSWALGHVGALREADPTVLKENMTFHLPMVLFKPGAAGAGLSETVRVTRTGVEVLTDYKRELVKL